MLDKFNQLKLKYIACIFVVLGFATFFTGINNPFQGDDTYQIVNNLPVHSITNIFLLFRSSTFYNGQHLIGIYYRPMMSTIFSLIYTIFGAHSIAYHFAQLSIYVASAFI